MENIFYFTRFFILICLVLYNVFYIYLLCKTKEKRCFIFETFNRLVLSLFAMPLFIFLVAFPDKLNHAQISSWYLGIFLYTVLYSIFELFDVKTKNPNGKMGDK